MRHLDHEFVREVVERLEGLGPEARPHWGTMSPAAMVAHLAASIRYTLGRAGGFSDASTWYSRCIIRPLIFYGILRLPKNIKLPRPLGAPPAPRDDDDIETLHALLDEYINLVQAGEIHPPPHPFFGELGVDGWDRLHVIHFEHHLRQFGI